MALRPTLAQASLASQTFNRTVYIRVRPMPESLAERRAVLRMLQRHGEVEVFKKLRRNDSFVSMMRTPKQANEFVQRAPIRYELITENPGIEPIGVREITPAVQPIETGPAPKSTKAATNSDDDGEREHESGTRDGYESDMGQPSVPGRDEGAVRQRSFVLSAYVTDRYDHNKHIRRGPLHGRWPREQRHAQDTLMTRALRGLVPDTAETRALADWTTADQLNDAGVDERDEQQRSGLATTYYEMRQARRQARERDAQG